MSSIEEQLISKVKSFLVRSGINSESRLLVGYSGGPDSTFLLYILYNLKTVFNYNLDAVYVNHGIRSKEEMTEEIINVKKNSSDLNLNITYAEIPDGEIAEICRKNKLSIEDEARSARYRIINSIAAKTAATHIVLGHNLDDQVETMIMRFFQGSGIEGLKGVPERRDRIIRPMMEISKSEVFEFLAQTNRSYVTDSSNLGNEYLRNRIRSILIPALEEVFPGYKKSLTALNEKLAIISEMLNEEYNAIKSSSVDESNDSIDYSVFYRSGKYMRMEMIYDSWDNWSNRPFKRLPYRSIRDLLLRKGSFKNGTLLNFAGIKLVKAGDRIIWKRDVVVSGKKSYLKVVKEGDIPLYNGFYLFVSKSGIFDKDDIRIETEKLSYPLIVRSRNSGDFIRLSEGKKSIKKIFNEWGVCPEDRWKIPVVEDKNGIIAVMGKPFGFRNRLAVNYKTSCINSEYLVLSSPMMESICE